MVTGISLAILVGESPKGLNATGDNEMQSTADTIANLQSEYIKKPLNDLLKKFGMEPVEFMGNQGQSALDKIKFEATVIDNALKLASIGEDYNAYLNEYGLATRDDYTELFGAKIDDDEVDNAEVTKEGTDNNIVA
jgi:hypothetical protein